MGQIVRVIRLCREGTQCIYHVTLLTLLGIIGNNDSTSRGQLVLSGLCATGNVLWQASAVTPTMMNTYSMRRNALHRR